MHIFDVPQLGHLNLFSNKQFTFLFARFTYNVIVFISENYRKYYH